MDNGREAIVTAKHRERTTLVRLARGQLPRVLPHTARNRLV